MKKRYQYIDHTADLGIEVFGQTIEDLFINVAKAIVETQLSGRIDIEKSIEINIKSESLEDLFIDWCRELLYNFSVHDFIPKQCEISIDKLSLHAQLKGDVFDQKRHKIKIEIKNPTYHNLKISKTGKYYKATIIFDV